MNKDTIQTIVLILACIVCLLLVKSARADLAYTYYDEEILYVFARGKPYPEMSPYVCNNNRLAKKRSGIIYNYDGKPVPCELKKMKRKEYEEFNSI